MLDKRTAIILKFIVSLCDEGAYKVIMIEDILINIPKKYNVDDETLGQIIKYLSDLEYITVKYNDDKVYCLSALPKARIYSEKESLEKKEYTHEKRIIIWAIILSVIAAFIGAFLGAYAYEIVF